jgi:cytochrome o ubiquinol oxidase subunit 1
MLQNVLLGKLSLNAIPFNNPIIMGSGIFMGLVTLVIIGALFYFKRWSWFWKEWLTSVDHKKIGIMYIALAFIMLTRGFIDAVMMRLQLAMSSGASHGYLPPEHYNQIFTAHGVIMIFFMAMPFMFGLINIVLPLQIGARDVAFPYLNSLSLWLAVAGASLINISLIVGDFAATGWLAYPPLSEIAYSPGVGVDYYIWALQISGIGSLLSAINFVVTIFKMRCPGMTLMKMPIFTWTVLCSMILVLLAFPVLTATLGMLSLDRYLDMHFFTSDFGGNAMMYVNLIWVWGHPEVYILILPAFGIYSEVVATFAKKYLFGYATMVWASACITVLSFIVWLHHFFTMGAGANVNAFFGIATMVIAIPTGVKVFNWLFTMYRGKIQFTTPMLWTVGFMTTFVVGGMTGVMMAIPAIDFQVHNSLFLVAHFHNVIIGGVVFGYLAGLVYWFPKAFGIKLNERLGKYAFWCWLIGYYVAFTPVYILGFMGMTRRLSHYDAGTGWQPWLILATIGTLIILCGVLFQVLQLIISIKHHKENRDKTGDAWNGRTLEWSIPSPAPIYNFAVIPTVDARDAFWVEKQRKQANSPTDYEDIHMPKNTSAGFLIGIFAGIFGFAMTWHIYWLVIASLSAALITAVVRTFDLDADYYISADEVRRIENLNKLQAS